MEYTLYSFRVGKREKEKKSIGLQLMFPGDVLFPFQLFTSKWWRWR